MARLAIDTPLDVRVLEQGISVGEALAGFNAAHPQAGAVVSMLGKVRPDGGVHALELMHYAPLTLAGMEELARKAAERFALDGLLAWHRVGVMTSGTPIVLVAAAARHRRDAFEAVDFAMDHLKSAAWFWKREKRGGEWRWVEPRAADHADRTRWNA